MGKRGAQRAAAQPLRIESEARGRDRGEIAPGAPEAKRSRVTHGADPTRTLVTGMDAAPEAAARRDPLSTYL